jgi:tetratricopeptide (TPR) repeat protein
MSGSATQTGSGGRLPGFCAYNVRILLGNTYWLIVTPIAATQLVLFWNMATGTLLSTVRAAQTIELLAPILAAFLSAYAMAPELGGVRELVFVRPVSFEKVLLLRLVGIIGFVFVVLLPLLVIYGVGIDGFPLARVLGAALVSMLFLSMLALAAAAGTRHPLAGLGAAGAFWALDLSVGAYFNPVVSLHGFANSLTGRPMAEQWVLGKLVLIGLAGIVYLWGRRMVGRPPAARRVRSAAVGGVVAAVVLLAYIAAGAAYKVAYGLQHEHELGPRARGWYQRQFRGYGPIPVAWLFGPAFPLYVQAELGRDLPLGDRATAPTMMQADLAEMRMLIERYPDSIWADNALFEVASHLQRRSRADHLWAVITCEAGAGEPLVALRRADVEGAAREFERLVERYPDSHFAPLALSQRAAIALGLLDFTAARACYERLLEQYPSSPEAYEAGIRMNRVYARERRWPEALAAAEIAAGTATWELKAEALLAAAEAARNAGDPEAARGYYQRARAAAQSAVQRAMGGEKRPSGLGKGELFTRSNAVMRTCERALESDMAPTGGPRPAATEVRGRILDEGRTVRGAVVALGETLGPGGHPSPFVSPAWSAKTDEDGVFELEGVGVGEYGVLAVAMPVASDRTEWDAEGPELPVRVGGAPVELPPLRLSVRAPEVGAPSGVGRPPGRTARPEAGARGPGRGSRGSRANRGRIGGRRGR